LLLYYPVLNSLNRVKAVYWVEQALETLAKLTLHPAMEINMSNYTFVINIDRQPLNPIHPAAARRLLAQSKAAIFRQFPFTIILKEQVTQDAQPLVSNLCLACDSCNKKKGTLDIEIFLAKKPEILKRILSQAKRPLKDAAVVNSTRWALFNALKQTNLPVTTGTGGQTKFNRVRLELEKRHYLDAACVGEVFDLEVLTNRPLLIKCQGHGTRQACRTDKFGFPNRYVPRFKFINGFQTGDIVKAIVTKGKKIGIYIGRIAVRSSGSFNISTNAGLVQGILYKYCRVVHAKDGYNYSF
jgi:hypothetical protein